MKRTYIPPKTWEILVASELLLTAGSGSSNDHADSKKNPFWSEGYEEDESLNSSWSRVRGIWED